MCSKSVEQCQTSVWLGVNKDVTSAVLPEVEAKLRETTVVVLWVLSFWLLFLCIFGLIRILHCWNLAFYPQLFILHLFLMLHTSSF